MEAEPLSISGAWLVHLQGIPDVRGSFCETLVAEQLAVQLGIEFSVAQLNVSVSRPGVLRGIHSRRRPPGEAKYVFVTHGSIFDVIVDLRPESSTFRQWASVHLDGSDDMALVISAGLGHGFLVTTGPATVVYATSQRYDAEAEFSINAMDPSLSIEWPASVGPILSLRDQNAPYLDDLLSDRDSPLALDS